MNSGLNEEIEVESAPGIGGTYSKWVNLYLKENELSDDYPFVILGDATKLKKYSDKLVTCDINYGFRLPEFSATYDIYYNFSKEKEEKMERVKKLGKMSILANNNCLKDK